MADARGRRKWRPRPADASPGADVACPPTNPLPGPGPATAGDGDGRISGRQMRKHSVCAGFGGGWRAVRGVPRGGAPFFFWETAIAGLGSFHSVKARPFPHPEMATSVTLGHSLPHPLRALTLTHPSPPGCMRRRCQAPAPLRATPDGGGTASSSSSSSSSAAAGTCCVYGWAAAKPRDSRPPGGSPCKAGRA